MPSPRLVAFDLDDTLAPSKSPISAHIGEQLIALAERVEVAIISGGQLEQFRTQVVDRLPAASDETLAHIQLLPTCGTQYYRLHRGSIEKVYAHELAASEKERAMTVVEEEARRLGFWATDTWGDALEDRGSQITYSALGQHAPLDAKRAWDPTGAKKAALRDAVAPRLPGLEVRSGGSTSIDITHHGIDKAYGMRQLADQTGIALDDMLFIGDRLDEGGNDYPVKALGVPTYAVTGPEETVTYLDELIPTLPAPR